MIETLHSLRFVFIMLIVFSHIIGKSFDFGGECGVSFFFILSGFVLSLGYGKKVKQGYFQTPKFLLRQLLKFYPLHLLTLVVCVLLDARLGRYYDICHLLPNILLLQSWIPFDEYYFVANGASWFLCDILFFYLVFSSMYRLLNELTVRHAVIFVVVVLLLYSFLATIIPSLSVNSILYTNPLMRLLDFCLGILLCRFYVTKESETLKMMTRCSRLSLTIIEVALVILLVASFYVYDMLPARYRCAAFFWFVIPPVIGYFSYADRNGGLVTRCLKQPLMLWLGGISLEIFLVHGFVFRIVNSVFLRMDIQTEWCLVVYELLLMIIVAWLTKHFFVNKIYASLVKYVL